MKTVQIKLPDKGVKSQYWKVKVIDVIQLAEIITNLNNLICEARKKKLSSKQLLHKLSNEAGEGLLDELYEFIDSTHILSPSEFPVAQETYSPALEKFTRL